MSGWMAEVAGVWWNWMAPMSLQVTALVVFFAVLEGTIRRLAWPRLLTAIWLLVLVKLVLPPTLTSPLSISRLAGQSVTTDSPATIASTTELPPSATSTTIGLFVGWTLVFLLLTGIVFWRYQRVKRNWLKAPSAPIPNWLRPAAVRFSQQLGLATVPRIRIQDSTCGPAVIGFLRPMVVLPSTFVTGATRQQIEHALLHELAHIRRRDPFWSLICLTVQLVYWFHPFVWLARRRLSTLRELGCDELVVQVLGKQSQGYRDTLLELACAKAPPPATGTLGIFPPQSQILTRLDWLGRCGSRRSRWRFTGTALSVLMLSVCCVPLASPTHRVESPRIPRVASIRPSASPQQKPKAGAENVQPQDETVALDQLQGSLQVRFAVMRMLAQEEMRSRSNQPLTDVEGEQP